MTFAIYIVLFLGLFVAVLNFLPLAGPLSPAIAESFVLIISSMKAWNFFFPIAELFICVGIILTYEIAVWVVAQTWRVVKFIRGHSDGA